MIIIAEDICKLHTYFKMSLQDVLQWDEVIAICD